MNTIQDISKAIELYYSKPEFGNADIRVLFGSIGTNTVSKLIM